jgi:hypothetical protein
MADIINLRQARKAKARVEAERLAQANRAKHGRSKAEKRLVDMAKQRQDAAIEGSRREHMDD